MPRISAETEWELSYGCHWNTSLCQWECHGLDGKCSWQWTPGCAPERSPKDWTPRCNLPLAKHHAKCPIGRALAVKKRVRNMRVIVDPDLAKDEIRVPDPAVAEWLAKDGEDFHRKVRREAETFLGRTP